MLKYIFKELALSVTTLYRLKLSQNYSSYHFEKTKKNLFTRVDANAFG